MAIPAQRFKILDNETNLPVADFLEAGNTGPLNIPGTDKDIDLKELDSFIDGKVPEGALDLKEYVFPPELGDLSEPDKLTTKFMKELNADANVIHMVTGSMTNDLYNRMVDEYNSITGSLNSSVFGNKQTAGLDLNLCGFDLNALLELLNRLTGGAFNLNNNLDAQLAGLLGLLNRLICAGVSDGFSKLSTLITDPDTQAKAGAGAITSAAKMLKPEVIIDVANSPVGGSIKSFMPDIAARASTSINGYDLTSQRASKSFYEDFKGAMDTLDPEWKGSANVTTAFAIDSHENFSSLVKSSIEQDYIQITESIEIPKSNIDTQLASGLDGIIIDPINDVNNRIEDYLLK
jgi:hypothetical protein